MHFHNANKTMSVHSIYIVIVFEFRLGIEGELGLIEFGKKDAMSVFFFFSFTDRPSAYNFTYVCLIQLYFFVDYCFLSSSYCLM